MHFVVLVLFTYCQPTFLLFFSRQGWSNSGRSLLLSIVTLNCHLSNLFMEVIVFFWGLQMRT